MSPVETKEVLCTSFTSGALSDGKSAEGCWSWFWDIALKFFQSDGK